MDLVVLEQFIKKQGWTMFGIADFEAIREKLMEHEKIFSERESKGLEADMDYLKKMQNDRFHPENKLPGIKSVIVLGAVYSDSGSAAADGQDCGVVARYARGKDYHKILKKKLVGLSDWLKIQNSKSNVTGSAGGGSNVETYISVDSGPTSDRVLAECAGLGFFGKNSFIIDPSRGSFFFIASLYTTAELPVTEKRRMPNCGDCKKCQSACPTGAIIAPGVIDARRCISYLTIENKGGIPEEFRSKIGNRIFGCDICQEVCPFNIGRAHRQQITIDELKSDFGVGPVATRATRTGDSLDLKTILSIKSDEEFLKMFAGTPLMRAKRRGLLRNACVVAGNISKKNLIPYLEEIIKRESDDMLKEHAKWAIDELNG